MAILTKHFEVRYPDGNHRLVNIPGFDAPIIKQLSGSFVTIIQTGWADGDAATELAIKADRGDPTVLSNVDALLHGTFNNCYKAEAETVGSMNRDGGDIKYRIVWIQTTPTATATPVDPDCWFTLSPTYISWDIKGGTGYISVGCPNDCDWTATDNAAWISTSSTGTGQGLVTYTVSVNSGASRQGIITVGDQTCIVYQAGV